MTQPCRTRVLDAFLPFFFVLSLLACPAAGAQQPDEAGWIPFAEGHHVPAIDVTVNGEKTVALIDTAISVNALSNAFANRAKITAGPRSISVRDVHGGEEMPVSGTFTMEIGGSPVELDRSVVMPLEGYGIVLGRPVLKALVVQIDYPGRRVRLVPAENASFEGNVQVKRGRYHQPMVRTRVGGRTAWMTLDTSNPTFSLIDPDLAGKLDLMSETLDPAPFEDSGIPIWPAVALTRLDKLKLGPFEISNVITAVPSDTVPDEDIYGVRRIHEKTGSDGILGYEVLRNFLVTLNLDGDEVHFYPK
ncbi:MAG: aspartyl protease family protein [Candidatus Wenzhouxiangella sp. M2_3B_020]